MIYIFVCTLFTVISCDAPQVENAVRIGGKSPPYGYKNFIQFQCNKGYEMQGMDTVTCEVNGWSPLPVCYGIEPYFLCLT